MSEPAQDTADVESLGEAYYDIAHWLGSAEGSRARVIRVLEHLRQLVPYERCAVLEALPACEPRLITGPDTPPAEQARLLARTTGLLDGLLSERARARGRPSERDGHIAVPLVGLDRLVGVLLVEDSAGVYGERHVRRLSVVAAKLAAYFSMLWASSLDIERARQLDEARQLAEAANRTKDEFLALVSHELRTPLNTILLCADALRSNDTPAPDRVRAFDAIVRSVRAEVQLIDNLLDLSCSANATLRLNLQSVDPSRLIQSALRAWLPCAERKSIRLEANLDATVTPLLVDPQRLTQVVTHLIANAIKFTPCGGRIEVRLRRAGILARIQVIDSGLGIRPEAIATLFERFRAANAWSKRAQGGLGVGLALVKDLVELHGGEVRAESPGERQGATFTVDLPLAEAAAGALAAVERRCRPEPGRHELAAPPPMREAARALSGIRILLVDDDKDICEVLQFVLESEGAVVSIATSAAEALVALERSMPHVLLSDIAMPRETGHELMRQIVARKGSDAPPAAALSAQGRGQDQREALAAGFQRLLIKPIDPAALITAVRDLALPQATSTPELAAAGRGRRQA